MYMHVAYLLRQSTVFLATPSTFSQVKLNFIPILRNIDFTITLFLDALKFGCYLLLLLSYSRKALDAQKK